MVVVLWLVFSVLVAVYAANKGRSWVGFFLLSLVASPLIGGLVAAVSAPNIAKQESAQIESGAGRRCPHCAEVVKAEAKVCKHCGRDIEPVSTKRCPRCGFTGTPTTESRCFSCESVIS